VKFSEFFNFNKTHIDTHTQTASYNSRPKQKHSKKSKFTIFDSNIQIQSRDSKYKICTLCIDQKLQEQTQERQEKCAIIIMNEVESMKVSVFCEKHLYYYMISLPGGITGYCKV